MKIYLKVMVEVAQKKWLGKTAKGDKVSEAELVRQALADFIVKRNGK